jgi:hypothetical protein
MRPFRIRDGWSVWLRDKIRLWRVNLFRPRQRLLRDLGEFRRGIQSRDYNGQIAPSVRLHITGQTHKRTGCPRSPNPAFTPDIDGEQPRRKSNHYANFAARGLPGWIKLVKKVGTNSIPSSYSLPNLVLLQPGGLFADGATGATAYLLSFFYLIRITAYLNHIGCRTGFIAGRTMG